MTAESLTCKEFVELVTDYLEEALPPEERRRFEAHLAACPGCDRYLHQIEQTIKLTGALTEDALDPAAQEVLLTAFRRWKDERSSTGADRP